MKRHSISFTKTQLTALMKEAMIEGSSIADVVRRLVDAWVRDTHD